MNSKWKILVVVAICVAMLFSGFIGYNVRNIQSTSSAGLTASAEEIMIPGFVLISSGRLTDDRSTGYVWDYTTKYFTFYDPNTRIIYDLVRYHDDQAGGVSFTPRYDTDGSFMLYGERIEQ